MLRVEPWGVEVSARYVSFCRIQQDKSPELYINQFVPSTLNWRAANARLVQTVDFDTKRNVMILRFKAIPNSEEDPPVFNSVLKIRMPGWAAGASFDLTNGKQQQTLNEPELPFYWDIQLLPLIGNPNTGLGGSCLLL